MHNTFTYRHSELPPLRPEIKAEIVGLDVHIADLILKCQGNYRELEELTEILDNSLDSCELNLNSIRIVPDDNSQSSTVSMKDLSVEEKRLIYSCALTNSFMLNIIASLTGIAPQELAKDLAVQMRANCEPTTPVQLENFIDELVNSACDLKEGFIYKEFDL